MAHPFAILFFAKGGTFFASSRLRGNPSTVPAAVQPSISTIPCKILYKLIHACYRVPVFAEMDPRPVFPFSNLSAVPPAHYLPKSFPLMIFADPHPLNPVASIFYKNIGGGGHLQFSIPYHLFLITYPLFFHILAHSFPLAKSSTLLFSGASALFAKSRPGWGAPLLPRAPCFAERGTTLIQSLNKQTRFASGDKVKKAIALRADRYFGEPPVSP